MSEDELFFFQQRPGAIPIYEALRETLLEAFPETEIRVARTQITFKALYGYAFVSLRRLRGAPETFIVLSLGLPRRLDSPRAAVAVEPYPGRWTNHLVLGSAAEIDSELLRWLREAHDFGSAPRLS